MTQEEIIFLQGAGIEKDNESSIAVGYLTPASAPAGIDALMQAHTKQIDTLISVLPEGSPLQIGLYEIRGFTFSEYQELFNHSITEQSLKDYVIFRVLRLQEKERKRLIYHFPKDRYEEGYLRLLTSCLLSFHALRLPSFFFPARFDGSHKIRCTHPYSRKNGRGKNKTFGTYSV